MAAENQLSNLVQLHSQLQQGIQSVLVRNAALHEENIQIENRIVQLNM